VKKVLAFWCAVAVVGLAYWWQAAARREERTAELSRVQHELAASIARLVRETEAIDDWDKTIRRYDPVLTIDLERVWLSGRPILFRGSISDIETADAQLYRVSIVTSHYTFPTKLRLSLTCTKGEIDALRAAHPTLITEAAYSDNLVAIARIGTMRTERIAAGDGEIAEMRIGEGTCVRLLFVGNARF